MALPFILLLQDLSPQVKKRDDQYVEGAEPGMFFDTVRQTLWDGEEGITVVPVDFRPVFIEWRKRDQGGGFVQVHPNPRLNEQQIANGLTREDVVRERMEDPQNHDLVLTHQHMVIVKQPDGRWVEAVWPMKSTALTPSRKWNSDLSTFELRIPNEDGGEDVINPPRYWRTFVVRSNERTNDKGSFYVPTVPEAKETLDQLGEEGARLAAKAQKFLDATRSGETQVDYSRLDDDDDAAADVDEDAPEF